MSSSAAALMLQDNRPLFALAYRFNCQPALDIHPGHLDTDAGLHHRLCQSRRGERLLSQRLARRHEFCSDGHWDFAEAPLRFAALDRNRLARLTTMLGAARLHPAIRRIVQRESLQKLKQQIGDAAYTFAVKRAPLLVGDQRALDAPAPSEPDRAWVDNAGLGVLAACWADCPPAVQERLRLKLPPNADSTASEPSVDRQAAFRFARRVLLEEIAPELSPCFN